MIYLCKMDDSDSLFVLEGKIVDAVSGKPIRNSVIEIVHADRDGKYFSEEGAWNPRFFGYVRSDTNGFFRVTSIRPGNYSDDDGSAVPSHFHFSVTAEGYQQRNGEIVLGDDPIIDETTIESIRVEGGLIADVRDVEGALTGSVNIPLDRTPSPE